MTTKLQPGTAVQVLKIWARDAADWFGGYVYVRTEPSGCIIARHVGGHLDGCESRWRADQVRPLPQKETETKMTTYDLIEQGNVFATVEAESAEEALDGADEPRACDYGDGNGTVFVTWYARAADDRNDSASRDYVIQPDEPRCPGHAGHDWQSPHAIVGGIEENPGVWGSGGGVLIHECCMHCGMQKKTDTWGQNPTDGTQGHEVISYTAGAYALPESE